jgi:hypothetical protein
VKYWEIVADNLSKAGWSWGCVSAIDREGSTLWIADAHRDCQRFVVRADNRKKATETHFGRPATTPTVLEPVSLALKLERAED